MSKRKQPEESTTDLVADVEEAPTALQLEESQENTLVKGWVIGDGPTDNEEEVSVTNVDPKLEREDGWEVEVLLENQQICVALGIAMTVFH